MALAVWDRAGGSAVVALSLSHEMPMVTGAARDDPSRRPTPEAVLDNFRELVAAGVEADAEMIILEMMSRPLPMTLAQKAAVESGLSYWCGLSARLVNDEPVSYAWENYPFAESVKAAVEGGPEAVGIMHTNVLVIDTALDVLTESWSGPLMVYPDSGFFRMPRWQFVDIIAPDEFRREARRGFDRGVRIIGGCCGLGLAHIRALAELRDG